MAFEEGMVPMTMIAGTAFTDADQYKGVKISAAKTVVLCSAIGEDCFGVLQTGACDAGAYVQVCVFGITKMRGAGALTVPNKLKVSAAGKFIAATLGTVDTSDAGAAADALVGSYVLGKAITACGADTEIFSGFFNPVGLVPTTAA